MKQENKYFIGSKEIIRIWISSAYKVSPEITFLISFCVCSTFASVFDILYVYRLWLRVCEIKI